MIFEGNGSGVGFDLILHPDLAEDGSEWALGHLAGVPETLGYFPKNYTVSVGEYQAGHVTCCFLEVHGRKIIVYRLQAGDVHPFMSNAVICCGFCQFYFDFCGKHVPSSVMWYPRQSMYGIVAYITIIYPT